MQTLSYGFLKPQKSDTGDVFFPAMETNIQKMNDHTHDGTNSSLPGSTAQSILAVSWVAAPIGGGLYRQAVTVPSGHSYDTSDIWFKLSTGEAVYPSTERITASSYYIYTNNNTLQYTARYR